MAQDDLSGGGPGGPSGSPPEPAPDSATSPGLGAQGDAVSSEPPAAGSPGAYAPPGFAPPGFVPSGYGAPYGPPPYPPQYGSPPYGQAPGYPPYAPPSYPASSWPPPQPGSWGAPAYPPTGWGYQPGYAPAPYAPPGPGPGLLWGGIGERFGALVIDGVILVCSLFALGLFVAAIGGSEDSSKSVSPAVTAIALIWWFLALIYHPACWWVFGSTPGQKALGLRVAQASNGQALGIGAVLVRYLIFFIVTVVFPLGFISGVMASNDPFKRAWHDEVARSVVVKRLS